MSKQRRDLSSPSREKGVTIVELAVALSVVAILAAVALPSSLSAMQTYRLNGAARSIVSDIRYTRSLAVSNGGIYGVHWGGDPNEVSPPGPNYYRLEKNTGTSCNWPAVGDTVGSNQDVISNWFNLSSEFPGTAIVSIVDSASNTLGGLAFNSRGGSVNPCSAVAYPVSITVTNTSGVTRTIEVRRAGNVRVL